MNGGHNFDITKKDAMIEVDDNTTIYGFVGVNCKGTSDNKWALLQQTYVGNRTYDKFPNGSEEHTFVLDRYAEYNFKFRQ